MLGSWPQGQRKEQKKTHRDANNSMCVLKFEALFSRTRLTFWVNHTASASRKDKIENEMTLKTILNCFKLRRLFVHNLGIKTPQQMTLACPVFVGLVYTFQIRPVKMLVDYQYNNKVDRHAKHGQNEGQPSRKIGDSFISLPAVSDAVCIVHLTYRITHGTSSLKIQALFSPLSWSKTNIKVLSIFIINLWSSKGYPQSCVQYNRII